MSVVFEPSSAPTVDIILVHGLQGHPFRTWAAPRRSAKDPSTVERPRNDQIALKNATRRGSIRSRMLGIFRSKSSTPSDDVTSKLENNTPDRLGFTVDEARDESLHSFQRGDQDKSFFYWPREALPAVCPEARVLTWGYDSHVTKGLHGSVSKSSVYQHGKDFLYGVNRLGSAPRPIILIAHSLGGIVVKEMLSLAHNSSDDRIKTIAQSTAAVVFLGTPHRGSQWAKLGDTVSKIISSLGLDTSSTLLDALGLKTSDLQRCQESFSAIWNNYSLRVKTFQEGQGFVGTSFGGLNSKIVDDISSSLGDEREHAEMLDANHRDMCRFAGPQDSNLVKIMAELADICGFGLQIARVKSQMPDQNQASAGQGQFGTTYTEHAAKSLAFPGMHDAYQPWDTTRDCEWLFKQSAFLNWCNGESGTTTHPILWVKGDPGSGKSTAIRETVHRLSADPQLGQVPWASFFFNSQARNDLHRSIPGLFRALLFQLLPKNRQAMTRAVNRHQLKLGERHCTPPVIWTEVQLTQMFQELVIDATSRIIILIDALDECDDYESIPKLTNIFHDLVSKVEVRLSVCFTTRHFGALPLQGCVYIVTELANGSDIRRYIDKVLSRYQRQDDPEFTALKRNVEEQSCGNFLWVVLVTERLTQEIVRGRRNRVYLETVISETPNTLTELYGDLVAKTTDRQMMLQVLQWAVLAKPLTLGEWRHLLPFLDPCPPRSFLGCQRSRLWAPQDEDLADLICHLSMGLVRLSQRPAFSSPTEGTLVDDGSLQQGGQSLVGRAGSLDSGVGGNRIVSVIHRSVSKFIMESEGSSICGIRWTRGPKDGHLAIMETCVRLIGARDLNGLVYARVQKGPPDPLGPLGSSQSNTTNESRRNRTIKSFSSASAKDWQRRPALRGRHGKSHQKEDKRGRLAQHVSQNELSRYLSTARQDQSDTEQRHFRLNLLLGNADEPISDSATNQGLIDNSEISIEPSGVDNARVLRNYPDILNYVLSELSFHAKEAQRHGVIPTKVIRRLSLRDGRLWKRWLCLGEKVRYDIPLKEWATAEGLHTWVDQSSILLDQPFRNAQSHYTVMDNALFIKPSTTGEIEFYKKAASIPRRITGWFLPCYTTVNLQDTTARITTDIGRVMASPRVPPAISTSVKATFSLPSVPPFRDATNVPNVIATDPEAHARERALVLGNATFGIKHPNVLTVELGATTPARETSFGFRITGIITQNEEAGLRESLSQDFHALSKEQVLQYLRQFLASESGTSPESICDELKSHLSFLLRDLKTTKTLRGPASLLLAYGERTHTEDDDDSVHEGSEDDNSEGDDHDDLDPRYCVKLFGFSRARWCRGTDAIMRHEDLSVGVRELRNLFRELREAFVSEDAVYL
ncbi:hypothetical protein PG996_007830 [Apiospora saccharicola]|uniref:Nephrocystin 3-like N-terminal domain-containing protein n=1 Tax=Apiospora saccharicola TaxID=335842 RepID=A0ABR1UW89_9PEZI